MLPSGRRQVFTDDGPKAIADVRARNHVWSLTPEGAWTLQPIQRSGWAGYNQILTVRTSNRTLRLNERHRVLVRRAGQVPAPVVMMADGHIPAHLK